MIMKNTLIVSNSWRPVKDEQICGKCGSSIVYKWGEYSFRYYEKKDKSDLQILCTKCAVKLKEENPGVKTVSSGLITEMLSLLNSSWKPQPDRQKKSWGWQGENGKGRED